MQRILCFIAMLSVLCLACSEKAFGEMDQGATLDLCSLDQDLKLPGGDLEKSELTAANLMHACTQTCGHGLLNAPEQIGIHTDSLHTIGQHAFTGRQHVDRHRVFSSPSYRLHSRRDGRFEPLKHSILLEFQKPSRNP